MKVYEKIAAITAELSKVGISKDSKNQSQGYKFRGIDQVYGALSPLLAKHGLCILPRVTAREVVERQNRRVQGEKLQGALEMAGGVAHHLNQPLTIVDNLLNEMLADAPVEGPCFDRMRKVQQQVSRMIATTRKIAAIKRCESMDYVAGVKIVDIEKSILTTDGEERA